jgi:hypothetical protein
MMGPAMPKPVAKDLVSFVPAALRVRRPTAAAPSLMKPRAVVGARPAPAQSAPKPAPPAKPSKSVGDSYEDFMKELSSMGV